MSAFEDTLMHVGGGGHDQGSPRPLHYWNDVLLDVFRKVGGGPGPLARTAAMLHGVLFDVVNTQVRVDWQLDRPLFLPCLGGLTARRGVDVTDAVNVAARDLLLAVHPLAEATVTAAFNRLYPGGDATTVTSPLGQTAVEEMLRVRAHDGSQDSTPYAPAGGPGAWRPTTPGTRATTPNWGRVRPFTAPTGSAFRPAGPGRFAGRPRLLASRLYADQLDEVRVVGQDRSTSRTGDQTEAAWFWANDLDGTYKTPGQLLRITADVAADIPDLLAQARLFALVSFALADAAIAAWDAKFDAPIRLWRPESGIRLAGTDGNPWTVPSPGWCPLSADRTGTPFSPATPAYVSGHATLAGAWAEVLQGYFGTDRRTCVATTDDPHLPAGTSRRFARFSQAAEESARSRVHLGVHFPFDVEAGLETGTAVGRHVVRTQLYPLQDH